MSTDLDTESWISQSEAARLRSVSRQAIASLVKKGRFRTLEIGGKVFVHRKDVESYQPKPPGPQPKVRRSQKKAASKKAIERVKSKK
jgi:excisionase family DNA binding protein